MRKTVRGGGNGNGRTLTEHGMVAGNGNGLCGEGRMKKIVREWEWQYTTITYIQNLCYIVMRKCFIINL
jgi:hypothetical protein